MDRSEAFVMSLVLAVHGSALPGAGDTMGRLCDTVRARSGERPVVGHLDHQLPSLADALSRTDTDGGSVVVPLLLGDGYHRTVDIPAVVAEYGGAGCRLAGSLSGAAEIDTALAERLGAAEAADEGGPVDAIVCAAAGSSRPGGNDGALLAARRLAIRRPGTPVVTAYCSAAEPTVPEALAGLRAEGHRRIGIVAHLLAPGRFTRALDTAEAAFVTAPLADHPAVADLVVRRYREVTDVRDPGASVARGRGRAGARRFAHAAA
ncbi:sirohydrochlorin chelatase [Streptomyces sp. VRA16 Mangrove soil]|uniref:sirohydrochlorin chelatase n=1 Tax=Streptomyces sp. VRA16 Mangrove soil TaxID=2817434 RepID=UPI001A9DAA8B|nr:CbiX/SirB N-terminal domain-containing protein [Streptomyces sp. VRA16 Mangrove soil]MBO1337206.1 sirohydrochlorin chelatase [Streptomyces sp. VRA16 Mangrove soil]